MGHTGPVRLDAGAWGVGDDRAVAIDGARVLDDETLDGIVETVRRRCATRGTWSLHGYVDDVLFEFDLDRRGHPIDALVGRRTPAGVAVVCLHAHGVAHAYGSDGPDGDAAGVEVGVVALVGADGRYRHVVYRGEEVLTDGDAIDGVVALALARVIGCAVPVTVDGRATALTLLAKACVEAAIDGGDLTAVACGDPVVMTAAVLDHLGGAHDEASGVELVGRVVAMGACAQAGGDWVDDEVLVYVGDELLRRTAAGFAQDWLEYGDEVAHWWGVDALVAQLDAYLGPPEDLLAMAAQYDFDLAAAIGGVIAGRRRRWGISA